MNQFLEAKKGEFGKTLEAFKKDIAAFRTGRANPAILEGVQVEAYGTRTALNGLASVAVADARSMTITPWDKSVLKDIEKSLVEANLNLGIVNEGDKIRVSIPMMTEDNRKDLVKKVNERQEKAKISFRQVRDEIKVAIETAAKDKVINEDDKFRFIKELDEAVTKNNDELKGLRDKKEGEIMEI